MTPSLIPHDAIGKDVRGMSDCLRRAGFRVEVYAAEVHPDLQAAAQILDLHRQSFWKDEAALLIYHHSTVWDAGQEVLSSAKSRVVIKFHNVTPPSFFEPYSPKHAFVCAAGERATAELALMARALFWSDSQFNSSVLMGHGASPDKCKVLAPFHCIEAMAKGPMDPGVVHLCKQLRGTRLLFVGGMKPNKGHSGLVHALAAYARHSDPDAVLILPGTFDPRLAGYADALRNLAKRLGLESRVLFVGWVDDAQLRAYYFCADVFLCLSEHEGFCVPLLESMYFRLPIVTHKCTAIPETVGEAALVWEPDELAYIMESIALCTECDDSRRTLVESGWERYSRLYSQRNLEKRFLSLVQEAMPG